uniref:Protein kinase domain-containing protein n=1 Tax=Haptolina brevifila TaxID=156173 RepID=A0A7S2DI84_9EUKA|mmetsp:Transcript_39063/g.78125  ORF Transcript_39063/g.78125 Transcript_39063/m.78125 type:complete len:344 (+) Transcript_39063:100-1131(+)
MSISAAESRAETVRLPTCTFNPSALSPSADWRELSDGGYSEVYRAKLLGTTVAVKAATSRKKTSCESMLREIRYLRQAGPHPNIVQPYGAFYEGHTLHLVLEYARHCLRSDRVIRQCDPIIVLSGVARALVHIHGLGIIHRDLKSRNVLVSHENRALLIDFGLACDIENDSEEWLSRTVGTKKYRPPEMRDGCSAHPSMDVYCYGLMIEKLVRQRRDRVSSDDSPRSDAGRHERCDSRLLQDMAQQCTAREASERPSAWSLLARLQRFVGDSIARCETERERVPLHAGLPSALSRGRGGGGAAESRKRQRESDGDPDEEACGGSAQRRRLRDHERGTEGGEAE